MKYLFQCKPYRNAEKDTKGRLLGDLGGANLTLKGCISFQQQLPGLKNCFISHTVKRAKFVLSSVPPTNPCSNHNCIKAYFVEQFGKFWILHKKCQYMQIYKINLQLLTYF